MHHRWKLVAAGMVLLQGVSAQAQVRGEPVRGSVSFFYRSNELGGDEQGFSSFGPQVRVDGSLMGDRVFYSANFAFNRRERAASETEGVMLDDSNMVGGARLGFRIGDKSLFELEYSNDDFENFGSRSVLFLDDGQQSSLGGIERGKSYYLALRNETQIGSVARLSSSFKYTDHSSALQLSSTSIGPLPDLLPDYLRRLELREHARGDVRLLGLHKIETGVRFLLDQIGIRASSGDLDGEVFESKQMRASSVGLFLQDRWQLMRQWSLQMGVAYEIPGSGDIERRSEWSVGIHRQAPAEGLQYGANTFLRNGFPQLADFGRDSTSVELVTRDANAYRDQLGLGGAQVADYGGVELFFSKPLVQTFGFFFSYTFSHLLGIDRAEHPEVVFGTVESDVPSVARAGGTQPLADGNGRWQETHLVHLNTSYRVNSTLNLGGTVNYLYADPLEFVTAEATLISPHTVSVDVHVEKTVQVGNSQVGLMFDVFNLLDMGSMVAYDTRYDLDLATLSGRRVQLGMRYGF